MDRRFVSTACKLSASDGPNTRSDSTADDPIQKRALNGEDSGEIASLPNKGPLLTIALALFGEGSFIANRVQNPGTVISEGNNGTLPNGTCVDYAPLSFLLQTVYGYNDWRDGPGCIYNNATTDLSSLNGGISLWLRNFQTTDPVVLSNTIDAAAFLATKAWLENQVRPDQRTLTVGYDMGADTQVPAISRAGIIVISMLLAIFLLSLYAMALYSTWTPRWTTQLDAFAMMRLGAAVADRVPLLLSRKRDEVAALDQLPGCVGDCDPGAEIGSLGVGAKATLRKGRRFRCYEGDDEPVSTAITAGREDYMKNRTAHLRGDLRSSDGGSGA